jgi:nifR3 family TIM-barrel protein
VTSTATSSLPEPLAWLRSLPFFQAGLQGYSDAPMRIIARRHGSPFAVTEAMLDRFLLSGGKALRNAEIDDEDHPIAGQIIGFDPEDMAKAARILVGLGYDVIDLNLACPVKKIRHEPRGGHLLDDPRQAIAIVRAVRAEIGDEVPLTVKLRRGYDDLPDATEAFHLVFEAVISEGFAAATVHGRTVKQKYVGPSKWAFLRDLVASHPSFTILGSGDIFTPESIFEMIRETGVQGVSVARGAIGNPWIFRQAKMLLAGETARPPSVTEQREVLSEQFLLSLRFKSENDTGRMMRKFGIKFSHHHPRESEVSAAFIATKNCADWWDVLRRFYDSDGEPRTESLGPRAL